MSVWSVDSMTSFGSLPEECFVTKSTRSGGRPTGREEVVEAAIVAAADQLVEVGPARMTVRTVAEAAGVNHALIHRHLQTKERLVAMSLDRLVEESFVEVEERLGAGDRLRLADYPKVHRYAMALARCLLDEPAIVVGQSRFPVLQALIDREVGRGSAEATAAARTVAWLCAVFGAEVFGPHLSGIAGIELDGEGGPLDVLSSALGSVASES